MSKITKMYSRIKHGLQGYYNYCVSLSYISKNKKRVYKKIKSKEVINVLFVIQYIPGWNKLELVYKKMLKDSRFNPIIVCVPSDINNPDVVNNDTYNYFANKDYNIYNALDKDNRWIDLKVFNPDYVFHSRPYNDFMPEEYSSKKIVKYALICNVLYGPNISINGCNVTLNKPFFRDCYCYFAFDRGEEKFYKKRFFLGIKLGIQKCFPYGCVGLEDILKASAPTDGSGFKKTIMWTPRWSTDPYIGGSNFFNYKDVIMKLAEKNRDVLFIIRPHPLMFDNFIKTKEMTHKEVEEFKTRCNLEVNIVLDEAKEYVDKFKKSDLLIADPSAIITEFFILNKPIIFCHSNAQFVYTSSTEKIITSCYEVHSEEELISNFEKIIKEGDNRQIEREKCIKAIFADVNNSSTSIVNTLLNWRAK